MNDQVPAHFDEPMGSNQQVATSPRSAAADAEMQRAITEVQASIVLAKRFPRDPDACLVDVKRECARLQLAEVATYEYSKGGTKIEGPSIRLAEALALAWGNIHSGWRELSRITISGVPYAEIEAWAWDMEKNKRENVNFKVKLMRDTKKGSYPLKDEREIYEHCANQAKRRERAAILAVIPGWIQDSAVDLCKETLAKTVNAETTAKMIAAFKDRFDVTKEQIEGFIQCDITAISPGQVVRLRQIFNSLKDGMSNKSDWFEEKPKETATSETKGNDGLKAKLAGNAPTAATESTLTQDQSTTAQTSEPDEGKSTAASVQDTGKIQDTSAATVEIAATVSETQPEKPATTETAGNDKAAKTAAFNEEVAKITGQQPSLALVNPTAALSALMDHLATVAPENRGSEWIKGEGQDLFEKTGSSPRTAEYLKGLGIHVITK